MPHQKKVVKKKNIKASLQNPMHPIWSGIIGFGLVNIPIRLYSPAKEETLDLDMLHKTDKSPIRYARVCKSEEKEIPYKDIVRGFQIEKGAYIVLTDNDFKKANAKKTNMIEITDFVDAKEIDPMYYEKPYYLEPDLKAEKAFALMREALRQTKKVGIATFVLHNREHLVALQPSGNTLVLYQLRFADQIHSTAGLTLPKTTVIPKKELSMAIELINKFAGHFKPEQYHDTYTEELNEIINEKAKGRTPKPRGTAPAPTHVRDLMATLKASLKKEKTHTR